MEVKAKKHLGQHFLVDANTAIKIAEGILPDCNNILEIGPGMGVLTKLISKERNLKVVEIDKESVAYLIKENIIESENIIIGDFLKMAINELFNGESFAIIGNFPYNISSQILFKAIENRNIITEFSGMFQKEVAERITEKPGSKSYGILSVIAQAYYDVNYLFTVDEHVFSPPPKVKSGVIKLKRKNIFKLDCDEQEFHKLVKAAFNHRRKMLRVSLKSMYNFDFSTDDIFTKRPEQLSYQDFIYLTNLLISYKN